MTGGWPVVMMMTMMGTLMILALETSSSTSCLVGGGATVVGAGELIIQLLASWSTLNHCDLYNLICLSFPRVPALGKY